MEGDKYPCEYCEHDGDCALYFDCSRLVSYYMTKRN